MILLEVIEVKNVWYAILWFFNHWFKFHESVYNGFHDLIIAIITTKNVDYCCTIYNISKSEAINLLENSVLEDCGYI